MLLGFTLALPLHLYIVTGRVYPTVIVIVHLLSAHIMSRPVHMTVYTISQSL